MVIGDQKGKMAKNLIELLKKGKCGMEESDSRKKAPSPRSVGNRLYKSSVRLI